MSIRLYSPRFLLWNGRSQFLSSSLLPVDRSSQTVAAGSEGQALESKTIEAWSANLMTTASNLRRRFPDATVFSLDLHRLFGQELDEPCADPQKCWFRNTTAYYPSCKYLASVEEGVGRYSRPVLIGERTKQRRPVGTHSILHAACRSMSTSGLTALHPTLRVHNVTAQKMAEMLEAGPSKHEPPSWPMS